MSSIYDALRRIQGEKGTWATPLEREETPVRKARKAWWMVAFAAVLIPVCAAGIYYGLRTAPEGEVKLAAAPARTATAPVLTAPARTPALPAAVPSQAMPVPAPPQPAPPAKADSLEGYLKAGDRYFMERDYANALLTYNKALHYFGKDVRVLNNIGSVYMAQGQPRKAIHYFKESNGISKEYVEPVYNLACAYARLGDPVNAVSNLKKACKLDPEAKKWAASDPDLMTLKGRRDFDRTIGAQ